MFPSNWLLATGEFLKCNVGGGAGNLCSVGIHKWSLISASPYIDESQEPFPALQILRSPLQFCHDYLQLLRTHLLLLHLKPAISLYQFNTPFLLFNRNNPLFIPWLCAGLQPVLLQISYSSDDRSSKWNMNEVATFCWDSSAPFPFLLEEIKQLQFAIFILYFCCLALLSQHHLNAINLNGDLCFPTLL